MGLGAGCASRRELFQDQLSAQTAIRWLAELEVRVTCALSPLAAWPEISGDWRRFVLEVESVLNLASWMLAAAALSLHLGALLAGFGIFVAQNTVDVRPGPTWA